MTEDIGPRQDAEREPESLAGAAASSVGAQISAQGARPSLQFILLLAGVTAIGPFAMQAIAPALPNLSRALSVSEAAAQSMISLAMLGMAAGAVVYGPLADHFGRRPVLLGGMILSTLGALAAFAAPFFELAIVGRLAQAVGAGAGMVLARAAAQDLFGQRGAATVIAKITAAMALAPMLAPAIGGVLTQSFGWRGIFGAIALASFGLTVWAWTRFRETARVYSPKLELGAAARDYGAVLSRRGFQANLAYSAFSLAGFFMFVSAGPYVIQRGYGLGPGAYGVLFVLAASVYILANLASPRVTMRLGHDGVLRLGGLLGAAGGAIAATFLLFWGGADPGAGPDWVGGVAVILGLSASSAASGLAVPNAVAGAVASYPERTGSASSLLSVVQFSGAALASQAATLLPFDQGAPLLAAMATLSLLGLISYRLLTR